MAEDTFKFLLHSKVEDLFPSLQLFHLQNASLFHEQTNLLSALSTPESHHALTQQLLPDTDITKSKIFEQFHNLLQPKSSLTPKEEKQAQYDALAKLNSVCSLSNFLLSSIIYLLSFSIVVIPLIV